MYVFFFPCECMFGFRARTHQTTYVSVFCACTKRKIRSCICGKSCKQNSFWAIALNREIGLKWVKLWTVQQWVQGALPCHRHVCLYSCAHLVRWKPIRVMKKKADEERQCRQLEKHQKTNATDASGCSQQLIVDFLCPGPYWHFRQVPCTKEGLMDLGGGMASCSIYKWLYNYILNGKRRQKYM